MKASFASITATAHLGWGVGRADAEIAPARLEIVSPFDLLDPATGVSDEFRGLENALWDTIGKILGVPVYQIISDQSYADWLPVYDSTIYFNDLLYDSKEAGLEADSGRCGKQRKERLSGVQDEDWARLFPHGSRRRFEAGH